MVERVRPEVWDVLEDVIREHPVMLNRAPTLHRLGIQAFEPILVEGRAIQIHPLVCTGYNADFDGDQMAVHVPLSTEAQAEARILMLSAHNILNPKDGRPVVGPTQDMVLGCYYLTIERKDVKGEGKVFKDFDEAFYAYESKDVDLHAWIKVRIDGKLLETTVGRLIFNQVIPDELGYVNDVVGKKNLAQIVGKCYRQFGYERTDALLDGIKNVGFKYATRAGITAGITDVQIPEDKPAILAQADLDVDKVEQQYSRGLITEDERYGRVIGIWQAATDKVTDSLMNSLDPLNPIYMMAISGARGNIQQIRQLAGMRGLMADPSGRIIDVPIKANFREGLTVLEYFTSTHGARKGLADTALRTADSGYLTRRLVDVAQDVIVREVDCLTREGVAVNEIADGEDVIEPLEERIIGRYTIDPVLHPETGEEIVPADEEITEEDAERIKEAGIDRVLIRTVLTCQTRYGVCHKCYGRNLATGFPVEIGEAVGIMAAQSIGEPGTQLTMRTFHTGGVAGEDITQGLPRVEELFEARRPKGQAIISEIDGVVSINENKNKREIEVTGGDGEKRTFVIPFGSRIRVANGQSVESGEELTEGSINPHELLEIKGIPAVQQYLLREVQRVYRMQGVDINDKHIEVMIRQMLRKVKIEESGDTDLLPGGLIEVFDFEDENRRMLDDGWEPSTAKPMVLGITKSSLATDSFLSAASFQETTRVLTEAAIKGKVDPLLGLKENVIIGKLIPAGTGTACYRSMKVIVQGEAAAEAEAEGDGQELPEYQPDGFEFEGEPPADAEAGVSGEQGAAEAEANFDKAGELPGPEDDVPGSQVI